MTDAIPLQRQDGAGSTLSILVEGMTRASCVGHVERAIARPPNVAKVSINLANKRADVAFSGTPEQDPGLARHAADAGKARGMQAGDRGGRQTQGLDR